MRELRNELTSQIKYMNAPTYFEDKTIIEWKGQTQPLVFVHFSHFNYTENSYKVARRTEWAMYPQAKRYYDEYFETLKDIKKRYKL